MKFRKKPVVIDAWQLDISNTDETISLYEKIYKTKVTSNLGIAKIMKSIIQDNGISIPTLEGNMLASDGDWIIQGVNGEFYPCKPDIFEKTYEVAE